MKRRTPYWILSIAGLVVACSSPATGPNATGSPSTPSSVPTTASVSAAPSAAGTLAPNGWVTHFEAANQAPAGAIAIEMKGEAETPRYAPPTITVPSGKVVLYLVNVPIAPPNFGPAHNVVIGPVVGGEALAASETVQAGKSGVFTLDNVPPGTYAFWCTVSAGHAPHYTNGQVGTLTVTP